MKHVDIHVFVICVVFAGLVLLLTDSPHWAWAVGVACQFPLMTRVFSRKRDAISWVRFMVNEILIAVVVVNAFIIKCYYF